jgi:AcrR family transcriptional regulator
MEPGQETSTDQRRGRPAAGEDPVKRAQIIEGARRVFMEMGFDAASMNDITRVAGVSKGTIYVYFSSKEELFEALIEDERRVIFADLVNALDTTVDLREALVRYGMIQARKITGSKVMSAQRTVIGICERKPELGARFYERGPRRGHERLVAFLRQAVDSGHLAIPDPDIAAYQLVELNMAGLFRQCLFGYRATPPEDAEIRNVVEAGVDVFLKAYAGTAASAG